MLNQVSAPHSALDAVAMLFLENIPTGACRVIKSGKGNAGIDELTAVW
ncbi:MAG: hypothetical protein ACREUM_03620 [Nitrosospira sp.]